MITRIRLDNFKSFAKAELSLGPLTVLAGTNASGKSNLRDAFRFLHGLSRGYTLADTIGEKYVEGGALQWRGIRGGIREAAYTGSDRFGFIVDLRLLVGVLPYSYSYRLDISTKDDAAHIVSEKLKYKDRILYDTHWHDDPPAQEGPPYIFVRLPRDGRNRKHGKRLRFLSNQPVLTQVSDHAEVNAMLRGHVEKVIGCLASMRFLDLSPNAMRQPSTPGQVVLGDRGENLSSVMQAIAADAQARAELISWIEELTPLDVRDLEFVSDITGKVLLVLKEQDRITTAFSASDGTLRFLALLAALLGPKPAALQFFEEIDNGIHPNRIWLLLQLLEQQTREKGLQVITTTHSPQLLTMLGEEARKHVSIIARTEANQASRILRLPDLPYIDEVLQQQSVGRLHEAGWFENVLELMDEDDDR